MSRKLAIKSLDALMDRADEAIARGSLDAKPQIVTVTFTALSRAFVYGLKNAINKTGMCGILPTDDKEIKSIGDSAARAGITALTDWINKAPNHGHMQKPTKNVVKFYQTKYVTTPFDKMKEAGIARLKEKLPKLEGTDKDFDKKIKGGMQRLHGEHTVGQAQFAEVIAMADKDFQFEGFSQSIRYKKLTDRFGDIKAIYTVKVNDNNNIENMSIERDLEIGIQVDSREKNPSGGESNDWTKLKPALRLQMVRWARQQDWGKKKASNSVEEDTNSTLLSTVKRLFGRIKGAAFKGFKKEPKAKSHTHEKTYKETKPKLGNIRKSPTPTLVKCKAEKPSVVNLRSLIPAINAKLHDQIKENMGSPALNYDTGRFAGSAIVTDIRDGEVPVIDYTYMRYPYETFEPHGVQGSYARDPKRVIGNSIREIASSMMEKQFITRRV